MDDLHTEIAKAAEEGKELETEEEEVEEEDAEDKAKSESEPEPISEELFQKAMSILEQEFTIDTIGGDDDMKKAIEIDTTDFLKGLVRDIDKSNRDISRGINMRLSAIGVVLKKAIEKLDRLGAALDDYSRAPAQPPKGRRAPAQPIEKSFPTAGNGDGKTAGDLTKAELKHGFNVLMDEALEKAEESGNERELQRIGMAAGTFESTGGMITKAMRQEIFTKVFSA